MAQITQVKIYLNGSIHETLNQPPFDRMTTSGLAAGDYELTGEVFIDGVHARNISPRNFRYEEPFSFDPDYQEVLDLATSEGIDLPIKAQQLIDNQRMIDYKTSGIFAKSDVLLNLEGEAKVTYRAICWKRKILTEINGSLSIYPTGITPSGIGPYINLLYNPATDGINYTLNNAGVLYYLHTNSGSNANFTFGASIDGTQLAVMGNRPNAENVYAINTVNGHPAALQKTGVNGLHRSAASGAGSSKFITEEAVTPFSAASTGIPNGNVFLFSRNLNGASTLPSGPRMRFLAIGANMEAEHAVLKQIMTGTYGN